MSRTSPSAKFFFNEGEVAQMMDVAKGLGELVAVIARQPIMDRDPHKLRSNPNSIHALTPSAWMDSIVGKLIRCADVDPPATFAHPQARLILMQDTSLHQSGFQRGFPLGQLLTAVGHKPGDTARRELDAKEIVQQLAGTCVGHRLTDN
jgi:hypothetical protein